MHSKPQSIVVIDGSLVVCTTLRVALSRAGFQVYTFQDPLLALYALKHGHVSLPHLFIVAISLPRMNGYKVMRFIRGHYGRAIPIIALSERDGVIDRLKARLAGANECLVKPLRMEDIIEVVSHSLQEG